MSGPSLRVAFTIPTAFGGFADCGGIAQASDEGLRLEFQSQDGIFGVIRSGVKNKALLWEELQALDYRGGLFRGKLVLTARSLRSLDGLPGTENASLTLRVARKDRAQARELAAFAGLRICERDLREMQRDIEASRPGGAR